MMMTKMMGITLIFGSTPIRSSHVELLPRGGKLLLLPLEERKPLANLPIGGTMRPCVTVDGRLEGLERIEGGETTRHDSCRKDEFF